MAEDKYAFKSDEEGNAVFKTIKTKHFGTRTLHRIAKCIYEEVDGVLQCRQGETGGWVEKMENLSQKGDCWIEGNAIVCGDAFVSGDAVIKGKAEIGDNAKVGGLSEVSGNAMVGENAVVKGASSITGDAEVKGSAYIQSAMVSDGAKLGGDIRIICPIEFSTEKAKEEFQELSETEKKKKTIEIGECEIDGNVYVFGNSIYIGDKSKLSGNVSVKGESYITEKAEISGNCYIRESVIAGPAEIVDVEVNSGGIGVVKNVSKAWHKWQERHGYAEMPKSILLAEKYTR